MYNSLVILIILWFTVATYTDHAYHWIGPCNSIWKIQERKICVGSMESASLKGRMLSGQLPGGAIVNGETKIT